MDRRDLDEAIGTLTSLLQLDGRLESDFQKWFERHPSAFEVLGFSEFKSHPDLTERGNLLATPDFIALRVAGLWEIVELKRPDTEVLRDAQYRNTFYASFEKYLEQCRQYVKYFADLSHQREFEMRVGCRMSADPPITIIAGRNAGLDRAEVYERIRDRKSNLFFMTYDDVLERLQHSWRGTYGVGDGRPGIGLHIVLIPRRMPGRRLNFIMDVGGEVGRNRVSLFIRADDGMCLRAIDRQGHSLQKIMYPGEGGWQYDRIVYLSLEICTSGADSHYLMECNGRTVNSGTSQKFDIALPAPLAMTLGTDMSGIEEASFDVAEIPILRATLSLADRHRMREYVYGKYWKSFRNSMVAPERREFRPGRHMFTESHPILGDQRCAGTSLVQPVFAHRPIHRTQTTSI